jgi:hypothetical protein
MSEQDSSHTRDGLRACFPRYRDVDLGLGSNFQVHYWHRVFSNRPDVIGPNEQAVQQGSHWMLHKNTSSC